jgi:DNA-binding MarR family transcriptional regulator
VTEYELIAVRLHTLAHPVGVAITREQISGELAERGHGVWLSDVDRVFAQLEVEGLVNPRPGSDRDCTYAVTPAGRMAWARERRALRAAVQIIGTV